jgi:hypothetical protein
MPRTLKQYYRAVLVKLGRFDETTFRLALDAIYPDDVFIASYPKSGNTWMRFLIAHLLAPGKVIDSNTIDDLVPDVYTARKKADRLPRPRFIKTHDTWFAGFPKTIYVVRDYRDVLISFYHYQRALKKEIGTFTEFLDHVDDRHPFGTWKAHVTAALKFQQQHPERMLIVKYEDLHADTAATLKKIIAFTGVSFPGQVENAVAESSFRQLQKKESETGSDFKSKSGQHFFREGRTESWRAVFTAEQLDTVLRKQQHADLLTKLGYAL